MVGKCTKSDCKDCCVIKNIFWLPVCVCSPAAGYAVGVIIDWFIPGETGESRSPSPMLVEELAAASERALNDQDHWQKLRVGAWKKAQEFSKARHMNQLNQLFETCKP